MHRTRRAYLRPESHPGPETVLLDGLVRVKRGGTATLHTTDDQHSQLLAEGWAPLPAAAAPATLTKGQVVAALARAAERGGTHTDQLRELAREVNEGEVAKHKARKKKGDANA